MKTFFSETSKHTDKLRKKHGGFGSLHEAYELLHVEVGELWAEIKKKPAERCKKNMKAELVQIASLCQILWEDN